MAETGVGSTPVLSLLHVRPLLPSEQAAACCNIVNVGENETVNVQGRQYAFDCVVGEGGRSRRHMCDQYIRPLVRNVCNGINCAVLAYGQTSSGKTYTMGIGKEQLQALCNGDEETVGDLVIPYALRELFGNVEAARGLRTFTLLVSFVEVYMEKYYDLLARRQPVVAKTRCDGEVMLVGAQLRQVHSMEEVIRLLQIGGLARITKGTNQNDRSSRSHAVLTIHVQSRAAQQPTSSVSSPGGGGITPPLPGSPSPAPALEASSTASTPGSGCGADSTPTSSGPPPARPCAAVDGGGGGAALNAAMAAPPLSAKLHLVDLAGSESVGRAGTVGLAAKEGNNINLSLMTLRNLIQMLAGPKPQSGAKVVLPYRDSKLTTLLRDALGGNSSTLFVACVSPADANAAMTVSTLEFATTARKIRTKPAVNIGGAGSTEVLELHRIILKLRSELEQLRRQVAEGCSSPPHSPRPPALRTSMTFSAAVAAASLGPSMSLMLPSPSHAPSGSFLLSHSPHLLPPGAHLAAVYSASRRASVASIPTPLAIRASATGGLGSAASVTGAQVPAGLVGQTMSPGEAPPWGRAQEGWGRAGTQLGRPEGTGGSAEAVLEPTTGENEPHPHHQGAGPGPEGCPAEALRLAPAGRDLDEVLEGVPPKRRVRTSRRHSKADGGAAALETPSDDEDSNNDDDDDVEGGACSGSASSSPRSSGAQLRRSVSAISSVSGTSEGGSNSLDSVSSYGGGSSGQDEWSSIAQLQQRVMLLEAENEHLKKHVSHLSAVIVDLRAQMDGAAHLARTASASPLPLTPSMPRGSASGASHLGMSVAATATARLQRMGASMGGGASRTSRTQASPLQNSPWHSPFGAARPPPWGDAAGRTSCEGTPCSRPEMGSLGPGPRRPDSMLLPIQYSAPARGLYASAGGWQHNTALSPQGRPSCSDLPPQLSWSWSRQASPSMAGAGAGIRAPSVSASSTIAPIVEAPEAGATPAAGDSAVDGAAGQSPPPPQPVVGADATPSASSGSACTGMTVSTVSEATEGEREAASALAVVEEVCPSGDAVVTTPPRAPFALPPLEDMEGRLLAMITWVGRTVAETEATLASQQAALRELLAAQGLTVGPGAAGLPSQDTLHCFAAQQLAGVEAELAALGTADTEADKSGVQERSVEGAGGTGGEVAEPRTAPGVADERTGAVAVAGGGAGCNQLYEQQSDKARRAEQLQSRLSSLRELQMALYRAADLQSSLELQREIQLLVAVYAGIHGAEGEDVGVATGPAVARAAAAAEQQLQSLRRMRRQQIIKEAAVAREKLRELEVMPGPPTPQQFGVVVPIGGSNSSGGGSATPGLATSGMPSSTLSTYTSARSIPSWTNIGGSASGGLAMLLDAGDDCEDEETGPSPRGGAVGCGNGVGASGSAAPGIISPVSSSPLPPLPPQPAQAQTPSLFAQFLPVLSPGSGWRRSSGKDASLAPHAYAQQHQHQHLVPAQQSQRGSGILGHGGGGARRLLVQPSQLGPWLDALLDYETRVQQYGRVLAGALQEREAVYGQLQEVEQELSALRETAAAAGVSLTTEEPSAAPALQAAATPSPEPACGFVGFRTDGGASFGGWMPSSGGADQAVRQHAAVLAARQAKLQTRLEELCMDVASLQLAIVEAQEAGSEATRRDDWWTCVPSLALARPVLRLLLERAAEYRAGFQDAVARADKLEQEVEELGLQYHEAGARLAAHSLELTATRAAALAAVAAPGITDTIGEAVSALLLQQEQQPQQEGAGEEVQQVVPEGAGLTLDSTVPGALEGKGGCGAGSLPPGAAGIDAAVG